MREQVVLGITMELLSDAIFGSGYSIPGGEDIAVCRDARGYPYIKGTTIKGLLRESLENLISWTDGELEMTDELFGRSDWAGTEGKRRLHFTTLTLVDPPQAPEDCYAERTFTSLEDGVVRMGTLRVAACARKGLRFSGEIVCGGGDVEWVQNALLGIKWAGTMRSRGFGRVRVRGVVKEAQPEMVSPLAGRCIRYRLRTESPVQITDLSRSRDNSYDTQGFIPGSAIRGMVIGALASGNPEWFAANKIALLSEQTRFLDAVPNPGHLAALPSIKGFYENKAGEDFQSVVIDGAVKPNTKRAKIGAFCALEGGKLLFWSAKTEGSTRIHRKTAMEDPRMFQTRCISAGQEFDGYILLDDPALGGEIAKTLPRTIWLGADRYAGLGRCSVVMVEAMDRPGWIDAYGYHAQSEIGTKLYLLAVSPFAMLDGAGRLCGIDEAALAGKLGVGKAKIRFCSTSLTEVGGYNRTWQCRAPSVRMYDRGSLFQITCDRAPDLAAVRRLQEEGLGVRRAEGFGQLLFLRPELVEKVQKKEAVRDQADAASLRTARVRRAKYSWVMDRVARINTCGLSKSQIGTIQALCEKAIATGSRSELDIYLRKNLEERGAAHGERFKEMNQMIQKILERPLADTLATPECEDSQRLRLELLCMLFDHSRKVSAGREDS